MVSLRSPSVPWEAALRAKRILLVTEAGPEGVALRQLLLAAGCQEVELLSPQAVERLRTRPATDLVIRCDRPEQATSRLRKVDGGAGEASDGPGTKYGLADLVGESAILESLLRQIRMLAQVDGPVLISGETGTGKELIAQALHGLSRRSAAPFVAINMAAIPDSLMESELFGYAPGSFTGARRDGHEGRFIRANGGTIFLDEVGDMPLPLQAKLLRVLQEQEVDRLGSERPMKLNVRVISATHQSLSDLVAQGRFRADLFYRLNVLTLEAPSLRRRVEDIPLLARHFLAELSAQYDRPKPVLTAQALESLCQHTWPGNVRELRNAMEHAFTFAERGRIDVTHLPVAVISAFRPVPPPKTGADKRLQTDQFLQILEEEQWNKTAVARRLGISRSGLYLKLRQFGIS